MGKPMNPVKAMEILKLEVDGKEPAGVSAVITPLLPPNQRLGTETQQSTRFSGRRPGFPMQSCLTSVAAARLFSGSVCMSSNAVDLSLLVDETPKMARWRNEGILFYQSPFSKANAAFSVPTDEPRSIFITEAAVKLRTGEFCQERKQPYRAFKLATIGHISIALWDLENKIIEVFDPSGSGGSNYHTLFQNQLLRELFWKNPGPPFEKIRFTNLANLQEERSDNFCQTWIYWYLYERIINKKSPKETLESAQKLHPKERLTMIASFWHFLETKT